MMNEQEKQEWEAHLKACEDTIQSASEHVAMGKEAIQKMEELLAALGVNRDHDIPLATKPLPLDVRGLRLLRDTFKKEGWWQMSDYCEALLEACGGSNERLQAIYESKAKLDPRWRHQFSTLVTGTPVPESPTHRIKSQGGRRKYI